jgi:hypothetical protein
MNKEQTIATLKNQLPGFYSVEQVIDMIEKIETDESKINMVEAFGMFKEYVENRFDHMSTEDIIDMDSAEFELNGNEISLSDICFDRHAADNLLDGLEEDILSKAGNI